MDYCGICTPFNSRLITDYATGDSICTECGLVVNTDFILTTTTMYAPEYSVVIHSNYSTIFKLIEKYQLSTSICTTVNDWITNKHSMSSSLKVICCAMHFTDIETFNITSVRNLSKRMMVNFEAVCAEIEAIKRYTRHVAKEIRENDDWITALQNKLVELCLRIDCTSKDIAIMKNLCTTLIEDKPDSLFHSLEAVALAIILECGHKIDKIDSKVRAIRKKLF